MPNSEINTLVRLSILESKLDDIENNTDRKIDKFSGDIKEINDKITNIKCQICNTPCNAQNRDESPVIEYIQKQIDELEEQVDDIRIELPEIRLTKQIVMGLVAIILTSVVGIVWNNVVDNEKKPVSQDVKKVIEEYNGGNK